MPSRYQRHGVRYFNMGIVTNGTSNFDDTQTINPTDSSKGMIVGGVISEKEDGSKFAAQAIPAIITEKPYALCYFQLNVTSIGGTIKGTISPTNCTVHFSYGTLDDASNYDFLVATEFDSIDMSNSATGSFTYNAGKFNGDSVIVWTRLDEGITTRVGATIEASYTANIRVTDFVSTVVYPPIGSKTDGDTGGEMLPFITMDVSGSYDDYDIVTEYQDVVNRVWAGDYGIAGAGRQEALEADGYNWKVVQYLVDLGYGHVITIEEVEAAYAQADISLTRIEDGTQVYVSQVSELETETCPVCDGECYDDNGYPCEVCNCSGLVPIIPKLTGEDLDNVVASGTMSGGMCSMQFEGTYTEEACDPHTHVYIVWVEGTEGFLKVSMTWENTTTCLSGDTMIMLADGSEKRLDALTGNELLMSRDRTPTKIREIKRGIFSPYSRFYIFEDGFTIHETHPHRFFNVDQGFYQWLPDWNIGDRALTLNSGLVRLMEVWELDGKIEMFGLWTESNTYFADGLLCGTAEANIPILENADTELALRMAESVTDEQFQIFYNDGGILP